MDDEKLSGDIDIKQKSRFLKWLDNWWYHNKIIAIISLFVIVVIVICTFQMCSRENEDITLVYSGPWLLTSTELEDVRSVFNFVLPKDYNGDGKKYVELVTFHVMSEEQILAWESEFEQAADRKYYSSQYESYSNLILAGECSIYLVDPWLYENLLEQGRVRKLTDLLGALPDAAIDEYGVRLGDTEIYSYYKVLHILPEDTVICLLQPGLIGSSSRKENYQRSVEMFSAIVDFKSPE
ncbi:MAG: hypothetical protein ACOYIA_07175 [Eubacteriales bacterium]|jgi:hypothetical protein